MRVYHDEDGGILYTLSGSATPPGDYIEVPEQDLGDLTQWGVADGQLFASPGPWAVWQAFQWIDPRTPADHAAALEAARNAARRAINHVRGQARLAYITDEPGQSMVYLDKEAQAAAWLVDPAPDPADYPAITAEVGSTADTAYEVAQVYINLAAIWRQVSAVIEGAAMTAHAAIDAANDPETCQAVANGFEAEILTALTMAGGLA